MEGAAVMSSQKGFAIGFCSECADREGYERFITTNETQWIMASMACRECASYEVKMEIKNG
jgi:hypothetical protein